MESLTVSTFGYVFGHNVVMQCHRCRPMRSHWTTLLDPQGRGSMDDKNGVLGILEAAEWLIASGFKPKHTIYFAFGHDEEGRT
jgi:hypothetical protein